MRELIIKKCVISGLMLISVSTLSAQKATYDVYAGWYKQWNDSLKGANIVAAQQYLRNHKAKVKKKIVVGIVDSGADIDCKSLKPVLWTNPKEIPDGKDNDRNGYADDVHGWNFLGTKDGKFNMTSAGTEEYRQFKRLFPKYKNVKSEAEVAADDKDEYAYYLKMRRKAKINSYLMFYEHSIEKQKLMARMADLLNQTKVNVDTLTLRGMLDEEVADTLAKNTFLQYIMTDLYRVPLDTKWNDYVKKQRSDCALMEKRIYGIEHDKDKRLLLGDDMDDADDRFYGNNTLNVDGMDHGNFVAGVVAGVVADDLRYSGVWTSARVMPVRVSPDGDEYDKDVASGIRYAVDNGAKVINVSLGKYTSPNPKMVNEAIAYAAKHDVLIVAAAGNDHLNIDTIDYFPSAVDAAGKVFDNYIRVGGTAMDGSRSSISNYGVNKVDLYAPGEYISGVYPGDKKDFANGTSVAAPVVSGIAAMLRSYFPKVKAARLKRVLIETAREMNGLKLVDAEAAAKRLTR
ncbi:S8 family serine peptidase [Prevotella sp. A2931]|uniref:S8 family serine peptidase n=2 Tax=Prevotellaceae TaxID=171552 RepID=A0ABS3M806_9BACT|nr:S8 family serine peptidase [Prevotella illustrans]PTL27305.1 serine protease [Prevotella sp. oral taxon 820]